jgi:integration host factor subunit beta
MTRSDQIAEIAASDPRLRQSDAELIVSAVFDHIIRALATGGRVELRGFGSFTMRQHKARIGRNPRTGERLLRAELLKPDMASVAARKPARGLSALSRG